MAEPFHRSRPVHLPDIRDPDGAPIEAERGCLVHPARACAHRLLLSITFCSSPGSTRRDQSRSSGEMKRSGASSLQALRSRQGTDARLRLVCGSDYGFAMQTRVTGTGPMTRQPSYFVGTICMFGVKPHRLVCEIDLRGHQCQLTGEHVPFARRRCWTGMAEMPADDGPPVSLHIDRDAGIGVRCASRHSRAGWRRPAPVDQKPHGPLCFRQ